MDELLLVDGIWLFAQSKGLPNRWSVAFPAYDTCFEIGVTYKAEKFASYMEPIPCYELTCVKIDLHPKNEPIPNGMWVAHFIVF